MTSEVDPEILQEFLSETGEVLDSLDERFIALEKDPSDRSIIDDIFRPVHSIKGSCAFFGLANVKTLSHKMENLLDDLRKGDISIDKNIIDTLLQGVDSLKKMIRGIADGERFESLTGEEKEYIDIIEKILTSRKIPEEKNIEGFFLEIDDCLERLIKDGKCKRGDLVPIAAVVERLRAAVEENSGGGQPIKKIGEILVEGKAATERDIDHALERQQGGDTKMLGEILKEEGKVSESQLNEALDEQSDQIEEKVTRDVRMKIKKSMRVEEEKIDAFMNYVGELIISAEVFNYIQKKLENTKLCAPIAKEFKEANIDFNELSNRLQTSLMDVRKVSIKPLLQKIPRMVRDISKNLDKEILLEITGEDNRIDKSILENLEAPLVHIVRNAADHGIESPEERVKAGKPGKGKIEIAASHDENYFYLTISDDGKGLDIQKIKEAALEKNIIDQQRLDTISDKETMNLIFEPGFSTADKVTDVSGRGVGMDVVMQNIKKSNGSVVLDSAPGKGSSVRIKLPLKLTLIVVDGIVAEVGRDSYIIPLKFIKESIRPKADEVLSVKGKGEMVNIRGELFPMIRLYKLFNVTPLAMNPAESLVIAVENNGSKCCMMVDRVVSQQQVVLKDLGERFKKIKTISGGAIMGDGKVGLVLNVEGIMDSELRGHEVMN